MSDSPRPQYFVARGDGTLTPLIAVDELPSSVRIAGVSATMTYADTANMTSLGVKERSLQRYVLFNTDRNEDLSDTPPSSEDAKRPASQQSATPKVNGFTGKCKTGKANVDSWRRNVRPDEIKRQTQASETHVKGEKGKESDASGEADGGIAADHDSPKPSQEAPRFNGTMPMHAGAAGAGTKGTLGRKLYCTHWIRWGECDYTQQGCLYKHEMPDEKTLNEIGISTYPRWYRIANPEKFGGITEVPSWHRRPGPAPTDQLWRGGASAVAARSMPPQSWEEFRENSRQATLQRHQNQSNQQDGGAGTNGFPRGLFNMNNNAGTFSPWNSGLVKHAQGDRPQYPKASAPRIFNLDTPFAKKPIKTPPTLR